MMTPMQVQEALQMLCRYYDMVYGGSHRSETGQTAAAIVEQFMALPDVDHHLARLMKTCAKEAQPEDAAAPRVPGR